MHRRASTAIPTVEYTVKTCDSRAWIFIAMQYEVPVPVHSRLLYRYAGGTQ